MDAAATPLLLTKLGVPTPYVHTLPRTRLLTLVSDAPGTRLILVSAPAGFGKTTFLATWCQALVGQHQAAAAWVALDEGDNDPARFLAYLVAALMQAGALPEGLGGITVPMAPSHSIDIEPVLTWVINALAALERECVLVLDDYHLISAPAVHTAMAFLLDHLPQQVRLAIGSRSDPPLPLARLRAREQLIEVRAADLRFTADEIGTVVQAVSKLSLTCEEVQALGAYAEGWPAGVHLLALALRAEVPLWAAEVGTLWPDPTLHHGLIGLNDTQRHVFAYLAEEVFERQAAEIRCFLLHTAVLDRLSASLCDAVLGRMKDEGGRMNDSIDALDSSFILHPSSFILEELERANLFVIALDGERRWYRYHHLFRAFLCARLEREFPSAAAELHWRASAWYEQNELLPEAVEHALAAGEASRAAELIERSATAVIARGEYATLHRWLEQIPDGALETRPALCLWAAWAALLAGEVERIEPLLQRAERAWQAERDQRKLGEVAHLRAHLARLRHDALGTNACAQQALANLAEEELTLRAGSVLALGAGQLLAGQLDAASTTLAEASRQCQAHNFLGSLVARVLLGDLAARRGQLHAAYAHYEEAIQIVGKRGLWEGWEAAIRLGDLARERNDLDQAEDMLRTALTAAEQEGVAVYLVEGYIALARTLSARGDVAAGELLLDRALETACRLGSPIYTRQIHAYRARLALARGDQAAAQRWQVAAAGDLAGELCYVEEIEALTLARVLIAQGRSEARSHALYAAYTILERLRQCAERDGRIGSLIEILALIALAESGSGRREQALQLLQEALALAAPSGYARIFLDEGAPMHALVAEAWLHLAHQARRLSGERACAFRRYLEGLLAAFAQTQNDEHTTMKEELAIHRSSFCVHPLVEALSEREREVLRLVAEGASNQVIAAALVISIGTVKSHINHILGKLAAHNRTEAVARAHELGLLPI